MFVYPGGKVKELVLAFLARDSPVTSRRPGRVR
jgi:hypothetical protein